MPGAASVGRFLTRGLEFRGCSQPPGDLESVLFLAAVKF
jgi:hypothetical protein